MHDKEPLECIPPAAEIRDRLDALLAEVKQLRILLRTATAIEKSRAEVVQ